MIGFRGLDQSPPDDLMSHTRFLARVREVVNGLMQGKCNISLAVTLTANAASTTVQDPRIGGDTVPIPVPVTANAAAELGAGTLYIPTATIGDESFVIQHANNAQTDRTFRFALMD